MGTPRAYPSCHSTCAERLHPRQVASLSESHRERQTAIRTLTLTHYGQYRDPSFPHVHVFFCPAEISRCAWREPTQTQAGHATCCGHTVVFQAHDLT